MRSGLKTLLVLKVLSVGLQFAFDFRDSLVGNDAPAASSVFFSVSSWASLRSSSASGALGGENFNPGLRRFFVRALMAAARFFDFGRRGKDLFLRLLAGGVGCGAFSFESTTFAARGR